MSRVLFVLTSLTFTASAHAACPWEGSASDFFRCLMGVADTVDEHEARLNELEDVLWDLSGELEEANARLEVLEGGTAATSGVMYGDANVYNSIDLASLAGYSEITGNLYIYSSPPTLEGLESLTTVGGDLYINSSYLTHVDQLENLTSIGGHLEVYGSTQLTNLDGLSNLTEVGRDLSVMFTIALSDLDGLNAVERVGGSLRIESNAVIERIDGLNALEEVESGVYIEGNPLMTSVGGLSALTTIGSDLQLKNNAALASLTGLGSLSSVGSHAEIMSNPSLCQSQVEATLDGVAVGTTATTTGNLDGC